MMAAAGEDRRFYGRLLLVFGPLFIVGGWLAAFTEPGAWFILTGAVLTLASVALLRTWQSAVLAVTALVVLLGWPFVLQRV